MGRSFADQLEVAQDGVVAHAVGRQRLERMPSRIGTGALAVLQHVLQFYLEDLLGRSIDLVTESALRPRLRPYVERDAIAV